MTQILNSASCFKQYPRFFQVGNRVFNLEAMTHVSYEPTAFHPATQDTWQECTISFANDECQTFYGEEAEVVWAVIRHYAHNLTPALKEPAA